MDIFAKHTVEISGIELIALKKLALVCDALGQMLKDRSGAQEQKALTRVLIDVCNRAEYTAPAPPDARRGR